MGRGLPHTQLATLPLGFLWLRLSAALVIAASVGTKKQSRTCASCMWPAGRGQLRRDPGPAHLVREASPMARGFSLCLLLPSPAQILHTLGSGIMNQWLACSSAVPQHLSQLRALPGALSSPSPLLVSGERGDAGPPACQPHLPPKACFMTKSMAMAWGCRPASHLTCTEAGTPRRAACKEAETREARCPREEDRQPPGPPQPLSRSSPPLHKFPAPAPRDEAAPSPVGKAGGVAASPWAQSRCRPPQPGSKALKQP